MAKAATGSRGPGRPSRPADAADRIIDALMSLLRERDFSTIGLADIAGAAGMPLAELRQAFDGKVSILAGFSRRVDLEVLAKAGEVEASDNPRDRLFDVMMRRFDALAPHREALASLARTARRDPCLAAALLAIAGRSQRWMLAMAGIGTSGARGAAIVEGAVLVQAQAMRVWLTEDDPGLPRTMAALDRALRRAGRALGWLDALCCLVPGAWRRPRRAEASSGEAAG